MNLRRVALAALSLVALLSPATADAAGWQDIGADIEARPNGGVTVHGAFRGRGQLLYNLDLDRGLDSRGLPLYPVPLANPLSQTLTHADMRLRADIAAYSPIGDAAVKVRLDLLDNLSAGGTPDGPPQAVVTQRPVDVVGLRRAYAEVLTPFGLLTAGRMGAHWGTGMLSNSGDCDDCSSGDAVDRIGWVAPLIGHIWAVAYDLGHVGPTAPRRGGARAIDVDPSDNVQGINVAMMRFRTPRSRARRLAANISTLDYGVVYAHRWQRNDIPATYIPTTHDVPIDGQQVVHRGLTASLFDGYIDFAFPYFAVRAEAAVLLGKIEEPSIIPGVRYGTPLTSTQWGGVLQTNFGHFEWPVQGGTDAGIASGDAAPGFGAYPGLLEDAPREGAFDGPQANPPYDNTVNNFRFHPDFHVDRILFRELLGTVTDAVYVRPRVEWTLGEQERGALTLELATVASFALQPTSTPNGESSLGVEIDPTIRYHNGAFRAEAYYALFVPGAAFHNPAQGLNAKPAQVAGINLNVGF